MPRTLPPALLAVLLAATASAQITATYDVYGTGCNGTGTGLGAMHILPATAVNNFGSGNAIPFGWSPNRFQQVFSGTDLPNACTLAALNLRHTNPVSVAINFMIDVEIHVGYTTKTAATLSATYANNWDAGAPVTVLPRSQVTIPDPIQPTSTSDFRFGFPFTTNFAWTPQPGRNLLVEFVIYGNSWGNGIYGYPFDNVGNCAAVWGTPETATVGQVRSFGPAMGLVELSNTAVPQLFSVSTPQIGNTFRVRLSQCRPSSLALLGIGLSDTWWGSFPLPLNLQSQGAPGCQLLAAGDAFQAIALNATGAGSYQYTIPNNMYVLNMHFYNQALVADPTVNALGWVVSNAGVGLIGNQ